MTHDQWIALLPYLVLAGSAVVVMLTIAVRRDHQATVMLTLAGLAATLAAAFVAASGPAQQVTILLSVTWFSLLYLGLSVAAAGAVVLLAHDYLEQQSVRREEFYVLLLTATLGAGVLAAANHFASFFLGLEILSVSLYGLVSYQYDRPLSLEAGIKYLVLAGVSSGFLLFGMALIYCETGSLGLPAMASAMHGYGGPALVAGVGASALGSTGTLVCILGAVLLLVGLGFKLALAPFHMWTPDIYQGAPAPVGGFVATVSKGAVFALLMRYFLVTRLQEPHLLYIVFALLAGVSMVAGNVLALLQRSVKRILGYSSIAHMGYLLVAIVAGGAMALATATFYLVAYFITMLGAFGVVSVVSDGEKDADDLADFTGLAWRRPWAAMVLTAMLMSLAGIPLTAGFMGKAFIIANGAGTGHWALLVILAITSAIGLYYYLRVIRTMFAQAPAAEGAAEAGEGGVGGVATGAQAAAAPAAVAVEPALAWVALAFLLVTLVWLGVNPGPTAAAIARMVSGWL